MVGLLRFVISLTNQPYKLPSHLSPMVLSDFSSSLVPPQSSSMGSIFFFCRCIRLPSRPPLATLCQPFLLTWRWYMLPCSTWSTSVLMERVRERRMRGGGFSVILWALRRSMAKTFWGRTEMVAGQKLYDCAHKQEANTVLPFELLTVET